MDKLADLLTVDIFRCIFFFLQAHNIPVVKLNRTLQIRIECTRAVRKSIHYSKHIIRFGN